MVLITALGNTGFQVRRLQLRGDAFVLAFLYGMQYFRYHIIVVTEGELHVNSGTKGVKTGTMDVCIVPPESYMKATGGQPVVFWLFRFTETYLEETLYAEPSILLGRLLREDLYCLRADHFHFEVICQLLSLLEKHQQPNRYSNSDTVTVLTFNLLLNCLLQLHEHTETRFADAVIREEQLTIRFLRYVEQHAHEHHDVGYYAALLFMTRGNLTKTVKRLTGKTPKTLVSEALLRRSYELLDTSEAPVYAIAETLNFGSSSAFVNFFRHHSGLTPEAYRKRKNR